MSACSDLPADGSPDGINSNYSSLLIATIVLGPYKLAHPMPPWGAGRCRILTHVCCDMCDLLPSLSLARALSLSLARSLSLSGYVHTCGTVRVCVGANGASTELRLVRALKPLRWFKLARVLKLKKSADVLASM